MHFTFEQEPDVVCVVVQECRVKWSVAVEVCCVDVGPVLDQDLGHQGELALVGDHVVETRPPVFRGHVDVEGAGLVSHTRQELVQLVWVAKLAQGSRKNRQKMCYLKN